MKRVHLRLFLAMSVGLLFVLLPAAPARAGGGCHGGPVKDVVGSSVHNTVDLQDMCFVQTIIRVKPGQSVTWKNGDQLVHLVTGAGVTWGNLEELRPGKTVEYRFDRPGVYPYACMIHAGMVGAVVVGNGGTPTTAGSSGAVVPVISSPAAAGADTVAGRAPANPTPVSSAGPWRTVALVTLGLLIAAAVGVVAQRIGFRRSQAKAPVG
jgi:plastocyanin